MTRNRSLTRRELLQSAILAAAAHQLAGCCLVSKPTPICPFDPRFTDSQSCLTIDVHAHVFNATDLQVKQFVKRVAGRQGGGIGQLANFFGGVLQSLAWRHAPNARKEMEVLARLKPAIVACDNEANLKSLRDLRRQKYDQAVEELQQEATRRMPALGLSSSDFSGSELSLPPEAQGLRQIFDLPATYEELHERPVTLTGLSDVDLRQITLKSGLQFVVEMFQYRFVSVYNYLSAYSTGGRLKVDLLTPALVDYDWWLAGGSPTPSSLPDQMHLMREITILSGGRVHALVPFDPYRQLVHDQNPDSTFSPLGLVRKSVEEYGAVGVKLYPPMGFAPYGNGALDVWRDKDWLTRIAQEPDFPARLDESMSKLYDYCAAEDVPVLGHSNRSNGPSEDFEALTSPQYWEEAANSHEDVAFAFGHFGGAGSEEEPGQSDATGFLDLMVSDQVNNRKRLSADASYFSNLLDHPAELDAALERILRHPPAEPGVAIDRLMYGSDWKMLVAELNSQNYLDGFDRAITELETRLGKDTRLRAKFFGQNAASFFGLRQGGRNRARLESFYARHEMKSALWMEKVDEQSLSGGACAVSA